MKKILINLIPNKNKRRALREIYFPKFTKDISILDDTKCLIVAPHPDDKMLGCGGFMIKYAKNCDCICIGSSGVKTPDIEAEPRADLRIEEFYKVMDSVGITNRWIFKTFGVPPMLDQMDNHFEEYCKTLDTQKYDYIFLPHPKDGHIEHRYITNNLFKRILKKKGYKNNCKIVFYEVWEALQNINYHEDISSVINLKESILNFYMHHNRVNII